MKNLLDCVYYTYLFKSIKDNKNRNRNTNEIDWRLNPHAKKILCKTKNIKNNIFILKNKDYLYIKKYR